jgi:PadR family transcriptional regulator, regulatory protein PadR
MQFDEAPPLLPGTLYMLVLRTLSRGPLHRYAIARRIREASESGLQIEDGSLYPALNRMLVKGWLLRNGVFRRTIGGPASTG